MKRLLPLSVLAGLFCAPHLADAQVDPVDAPGCQLGKNPKAFDGKLVRVRGALSVHFEDFSLHIPNCDTRQGIWLAFGGDVPGIVPSTANDIVRRPGSDIKVNDASYGIKKDITFWKLYALISARHGDKRDYRVSAMLMGMFFSGEELRNSKGDVLGFGGYGHLGCCALLVITQISDVESAPPANLSVHGVLLGIDGQPVEGFTVIDDVLGGTPPGSRTAVTDKQGRFAFSNSGQQLRFESPFYRPLTFTVETGGSDIRVRLEAAKQSDWVIRACDQVLGKRVGFSVLFALPKTMESEPFKSDDRQSIFVYDHGGSAPEADLIISQILDGTTEEFDSLDSERFEERWIKDEAGRVVGIDARGRLRDGKYRRRALFFAHDDATYWLDPGKAPKALDEVIDSACVARDATR